MPDQLLDCNACYASTTCKTYMLELRKNVYNALNRVTRGMMTLINLLGKMSIMESEMLAPVMLNCSTATKSSFSASQFSNSPPLSDCSMVVVWWRDNFFRCRALKILLEAMENGLITTSIAIQHDWIVCECM